MFNSTILKEKLFSLIGWKQHYDPDEFQIDADLTQSESGEYYQEQSPALQLSNINAVIRQNQDINEYLREKVENGIVSMLNDLERYRMSEKGYGKTILEQSTLLNRSSWAGDRIVNLGRFCGLVIQLRDITGLTAVLNEIGLQLDGADEIPLFLFHSAVLDPIDIFTMSTINSMYAWKKVDAVLSSMQSEVYHGGFFVLGYYQDDLVRSAINYSNFNWSVGECGTCGGNNYYGVWQSIKENFFVYPFYVADGNYQYGEMFDPSVMQWDKDTSYGLNLKFSAYCDFTEFFIQNRLALKSLLGLKVAGLVLNDMKYSQETNAAQYRLQDLAIREIEGDKETNYLNVQQQYNRELKAVAFNISGINSRCLPCEDQNTAPTYTAI